MNYFDVMDEIINDYHSGKHHEISFLLEGHNFVDYGLYLYVLEHKQDNSLWISMNEFKELKGEYYGHKTAAQRAV